MVCIIDGEKFVAEIDSNWNSWKEKTDGEPTDLNSAGKRPLKKCHEM